VSIACLRNKPGVVEMESLKIGLIGSGFMGKTHAIAFHALPVVFPTRRKVVCEMVADATEEMARHAAGSLGYRRWTADWKELASDPDIDVVDICTPNHMHKEIALTAIAAGKHVYCEKPLSLNPRDSLEMTEAAEERGVKTLVGFNYVKNPATALAKEIIGNGEIGKIVHFRGTHVEDYLCDPLTPYTWRLQRNYAGSGALGDLCHVISMAQYLVGPITEVCGDIQTVISERPLPGAMEEWAPVENEDQAHFMARFANGAIGTLEVSRVATGRKMGLTYEITGTQGSLYFDQERMSELKLYVAKEPAGRQGFKTLLLGPQHPDYAAFSPAPGHGLGYNDMKIVEARDLVDGISGARPLWPDFRAGWEIDRIIDAVLRSHEQRRWISLETS
jgi:predicted dehydrogenase